VFLLERPKSVFLAFTSIYYIVCFEFPGLLSWMRGQQLLLFFIRSKSFPSQGYTFGAVFVRCANSASVYYQMGTYTVYKETGAFKFIGGLPRCLPLAFSTAILSA